MLPHCMQLLEVTIEDSDQERQRSEREADELQKLLGKHDIFHLVWQK